jgi:serine/threonine protein kinase
MAAANRVFFVGPDDDPDRYRLLRQVGGGGEAELWKADMAFAGGREPVAVKILRAGHAAEFARWHERWAEQAELLRMIRHPGVVGVHGQFAGAPMHLAGEAAPDGRALYLVMNWVDGQDLRDWVPQHAGPTDRAEALRHLVQVADVLDWLHGGGGTPSGRRVIHGDISPANVVVNTDGQAVLVDFGLFRITGHVTALPVGTPGYCAPEVVAGGEYSIASDRFAFGGLTHYLLTGQHPPADRKELRRSLHALAGTIPPAGPAYTLLARMFAADPADRPPAGEWIRGLRLQSSTAPVRTTAPPPPARVRPAVPGPPGRRWAPAAIAGVAAVALAIAIPLMTGGGAPQGAGPTPTAGAASSQPAGPAKALQTTASADPAPTHSPVPVPLVSIQPASSELVPGEWTLDDVTYIQSIGCSDCQSGATAVYNTAGRYRTLTGVLATKADFEDANLTVTVDSKDPVTRHAIAGRPNDFAIDVSGAKKVTITLDTTGGCCRLTIIGRATFIA